MERISIFNYEAFYLDYLEGNLNEEDVAMLLNLLEKHPELKVEMDEYPVLHPQNNTIDSIFVNSLKQVDFELDAINLNNSEAFAIASVEQQISADKQKELEEFAEKNNVTNELISSYNKIKLTPDFSVVYPKKTELKKSRKIVLWPYVSAVASLLIFFFVYQGLDSKTVSTGEKLTAKNRTLDQKLNHRTKDSLLVKAKKSEIKLKDNIRMSNDQEMDIVISIRKNQLKNNDKELILEKDPDLFKVEIANSNEKNSEKKVNQSPKEIVKYEQSENSIATIGVSNSIKDNSLVAYNEMKNPIKPITNRLSEFTKTEIDLRRVKTTSEKRGRFYLKIGNLEVERPMRK